MEQSILLNKGSDERRGSVLIWIRNLCLRAPFLSRLPSTTPLWFKAVFGFSSASQVITFQHVAPFRGGINQCCYFFIPHTAGPRGTKKKRRGERERKKKKKERCRYFDIVTSCTLACMSVLCERPLLVLCTERLPHR